MLTRQPVQGRANDGGLRIGEMERDGVLAHGMSYFLNESFMIRADEYYMAVCNKTGCIAIYNESKNLFLSPYADGPINFHTNPDDTMNIKNISKFGRSFSLLRIPYSFKLLIQELLVMNIQMRIITENNVEQLTNMCYSTNINKLLNSSASLDETIKDYINSVKNKLSNSNTYNRQDIVPYETPQLPTDIDEGSEVSAEGYVPESPQYPPESPQYPPESPQYPPDYSPPYAPYSPAYVPSSPIDIQSVNNNQSPAYRPFTDSNSGNEINVDNNKQTIEDINKDKSILDVEEPVENKVSSEDMEIKDSELKENSSQSGEKRVIINLDKNENIGETDNSSNSKKITL
jgi:hypothetical protein